MTFASAWNTVDSGTPHDADTSGESEPGPTLFVSHATADRDLVNLVVDLLWRGIGIPRKRIFYSSRPAQGVRPGTAFPTEIDDQLRRADVFVPVITRHFLRSQYALAELGFGRALGKWAIPIVLIPPEEAQTTLLLLNHAQAVDPRDSAQLDLLKDELPRRYGLRDSGVAEWNEAKDAFLAAVQGLADAISAPAQPAAPAVATTGRIFARSDSNEFHSYAESLLSHAKRVVMVGIGLNILHRDPILSQCLGRVDRGELELEIYLADPSSPEIQVRLLEEELGSSKPPVGERGLRRRLEALIDARERMDNPSRLHLGVFRNYPTFATLQIDDRLFMYPYGYATVGNFSPVLEFDVNAPEHGDMVMFLQEQIARVRAASLPAQEAIGRAPPRPAGPRSTLAVYAIPPATSELYRVGSRLLGYDVRRCEPLESPIAEFVGRAASFGFHLTIADVLQYDDVDREWALAEVEALVREFDPFPLTDLELRTQFPDPSSVSLVVSDPTRSLEALHCELVFRLYRRARSSDYTRGNVPRRPAWDRSRLIVRRYRAPYILKEFHPHFTLASGVPQEQSNAVKDLVEREVRGLLGGEMDVEQIALMGQTETGAWRIEKELTLGSR